MDLPFRSAAAEASPSSLRDNEPLSPTEESVLKSRISLRLIPLLFCCYVIAYIDRINVGFAKLQLKGVLDIDPARFDSAFGFGAGLFFIGYFLFEVPSNLMLHRIGARIWIARIMIVWGIVSMSFMFMKSEMTFYLLRFLLGVAEAGFFPGIILYITFWYPPAERARVIALFASGAIVAGLVGSPISGALLGMDGIGGLAGWQWLFFLEALPAVVLGFVVLFALPDTPQKARWLSPREKKWIADRLVPLPGDTQPSQSHSLRDCFTNPVVWLLCVIYFMRNVGTYGCEMWLPSIIKGVTEKADSVVGWINGIPYLVAGVVMYLVGRSSDKTGERRGHMAAGAVCATIGFVAAANATHPFVAIAALTLAFAGSKATLPPFWAMSSQFLKGTAAAGGIALINSVGNLGGFVGPYSVGFLKDKTGSNFAGLLLLGACYCCVALLAFAVPAKRPPKV